MMVFKHIQKLSLLNIMIVVIMFSAGELCAQRGYYDAPYTRYEANVGTLANASITPRSFNQWNLQSEASEQVCVDMTNSGASVQWNVSADGDGLVVRYSVPDGQSGVLEVYANGTFVGTMNLTSYYSWESLWNNGNANNTGVTNQAPKMRFDEVRMKLPSKILAGQTLKLVRQSGNITLDFAELEPVPAAIGAVGAVYGGNGSDLQNFIDTHGGQTIFLPAGVYNVNNTLYFANANTTLRGAGMWYTQINFTNGGYNLGGLWANANNISYSDLYLTTVRNSRSNSYKAINGAYIGGSSTITRVWAEHFECGAWIADYDAIGPDHTDGLRMSYCRFRNNYADGTNLCKGTLNTIVEHCSYRNNGDDDMAIWSANGWECRSNTFQYNTSENTWRSAGIAIYGGYNNVGQHLLIQDNVEVGIKVNNAFGGAGFNGAGMHVLYDITIKRGGTYYDLFNTPVGAIDIGSYDWGAGTRVQNVTFSCIDVLDSKNDAIYMKKVTSGSDGLYNLIFQNINIDGTGLEYPDNGGTGAARGFDLLFSGYPNGYGTYCNMTFANRGGNAPSNVNTSQIGSFSWTQLGTCPGGCVPASTALVTITSPTNGISFNGCPVAPITITATATPPTGNTVSYVEFFVDGVSIGTDNSSPYAITWNSPTDGPHAITAIAHFGPSNTTTTSAVTNISVGGVRLTSSPPTIDGTIDPLWSYYPVNNLTQGYSNPPDLAAYFKMTYDATNLYVLVNVTDNILVSTASGGTWLNDGVELYIDMGNTKTGTYGANDFQYSFNWNSATIIENKHNAVGGVTLGQTTTAGGYVMEVKIPWSTIGTAPTGGTLMGFDVKVNDDDDGSTRAHQLGWHDGTFNAWSDPSLFGTVQFSNCGPLPVSLFSFAADVVQETVVLNWATASETDNQKFIIERSADLSTWEPVNEISSNGNSTSLNQYSYTDYKPFQGTSYYRLKQVDVNGNFAYSNVVVVNTGAQLIQVNISPNPFDDIIFIQSNVSTMLEISIYDVLGSLLFHASEESSDGTITIRPELSSGAYIMTIVTDNFIEQKKIIKK